MFDIETFKQKKEEIIAWLQKEFTTISTGRANPALLDGVQVDSYGAMQPVKNVASITLEDARTLRVVPWDGTLVKAIEKAVIDSKLPMSVATDDKGLRISTPQLTEETRKDIVKLTKAKHEDARVKVRQLRESTVKEIDQLEISDDEKRDAKTDLQKEVDSANDQLKTMTDKKEADIMTV